MEVKGAWEERRKPATGIAPHSLGLKAGLSNAGLESNPHTQPRPRAHKHGGYAPLPSFVSTTHTHTHTHARARARISPTELNGSAAALSSSSSNILSVFVSVCRAKLISFSLSHTHTLSLSLYLVGSVRSASVCILFHLHLPCQRLVRHGGAVRLGSVPALHWGCSCLVGRGRSRWRVRGGHCCGGCRRRIGSR